MRLSTNRYNIIIEKDGVRTYEGYYGYTSRKTAEERAEAWRRAGFKAEVTDSKRKRGAK